ncbi:DDE-type integrase/transposase/recombinase [Candidatus Protofrankia californiensis]|uniref:DDE-type integrase/transposase/recombinase n=1 Tax=Candidatus Protofrankia californiensis TaxID=1839754 RepID=UPI0010411696|nr:DDE-type integrase/transposase/recombinase [Candidatus Protofrankia californiensis]
MNHAEREDRARAERARTVGLFRYTVIQEVVDPALSTRQRGRMVRALAETEHRGPSGAPVRVSRASIDRWVRAYRVGGFTALVPRPANVTARTPAEVLEVAAALKRENPARTAAQVVRILRASCGWAPSERTVQRHFVRVELSGVHVPAGSVATFGRFEAERPNELWTGDALHGPMIGTGRKTYLFAFVDDHSRAVMGARFGYHEDTVRLAAALRPALAARGVPERIYVDNGSAFVDSWLLRGCATLDIKLTHSTPGRPEGRGKIERLFKTVRQQFLVELDGAAAEKIQDLAELNRLLTAWVETVYHTTVHSETGRAPLERWRAGLPDPLPRPSPAQLREAFLWSEQRKVTRTGTVSLHANSYQVDPSLTGRTVELVFDPFDLTDIEIRHRGHSYGPAAPFRIGRHSHPKARPEQPEEPPPATGINYLHLLDAAHTAELEKPINYAALAINTSRADDGQLPGQLDLTGLPDRTDNHNNQDVS